MKNENYFNNVFSIFCFLELNILLQMNGNNMTNNLMCNQNQIPKNLPLKKRRAYIMDIENTNNGQDENYLNHRSTTNKQ